MHPSQSHLPFCLIFCSHRTQSKPQLDPKALSCRSLAEISSGAGMPQRLSSYISRTVHSTTKIMSLRCVITRSARRVRWNSSSDVTNSPTIASKSSLCELKMT